MPRLRFAVGGRYLFKEQVYVIRQALTDHRFLVENVSFGGQITVSYNELVQAWADGDLRLELQGPNIKVTLTTLLPTSYKFADFQKLPLKVRDEAWRRYQLIRPLIEGEQSEDNNNIKSDKSEAASSDVIAATQSKRTRSSIGQAESLRSQQRWLAAFRLSGGDIRSLVPDLSGHGQPGKKRLDNDVESIITDVLAKCAASPSQRTSLDVYYMIVERIKEINSLRQSDDKLICPGQTTIYRRICEAGKAGIVQRRRSRKEKQADSPSGNAPLLTRILQRIEIDNVLTHLILVDEVDRLPIGRANITFATDVYSGFPFGLYVGFEHASYFTVMHCLLHGILPKGDVCKTYQTKHSWDAYGLPEILVVDNGKEFIGRDLEDACAQLGIVLEQMPISTPWFKGAIERFFRTNNTGLIHSLPGTTLSTYIDLGDEDPKKFACISLSAFWQLLHVFLLDYYAQKRHEGKQCIPARRWAESVADGFVPPLHHDAKEVRILLMRSDTRILGRQGIEWESLRFNSLELQQLFGTLDKDKREVRFKYDPGDISTIYVYDHSKPGGEWLAVPCTSQDYANGLSLWKHRVIRKYVLRNRPEVNIEELAAAKAHIRKIVEKEFNKTKDQRGRKRVHLLRESQNSKTESPDAETDTGSKENNEDDNNTSSNGNTEDSSSEPLANNPKEDTTSHIDPSTSSKPTSGKTRRSRKKNDDKPDLTELDGSENELDLSGWGGDYNLPILGGKK